MLLAVRAAAKKRTSMRITCPSCGFSRDMPEDKVPSTARLATCPKCRHKFRLRKEEDSFLLEDDASGEQERSASPEAENDPEPASESDDGAEDTSDNDDIWRRLEGMNGDPSAFGAGGKEGTSHQRQRSGEGETPWERLQSMGFFPGLYETVKQVMLTPSEFFSGLSGSGGFRHPAAFYLLIMEVPALALVFWLMSGLLPEAQSEAGGLFEVGLTGIGALTFVLVFPVFMVINLFLSSGMYHLLLLTLGEGSAGFEGTFRVVCYSAAPMVLALVPVFGMWAGGIWQLVCLFFGFRFVHGITAAKAALPIILVQVLFVLLLSAVGGVA